MARRRFFVEEVHDGRAEITGENAHHLTRVLRVEPGQKYEIADGNRVWLAAIVTSHKNKVEFCVEQELEPMAEPIRVTLYLSLIKFDRFEWAVEKATELGVFRIVPVEAARGDRGLFAGAHKRVERWRRIAHEAGEQSRRLRAPVIGDPVRLSAVLSNADTHRVWLDEERGAPLLARAIHLTAGETVGLAVGPEGGWTPDERGQFTSAQWTGASLGPSVLRAETAACAGLAVILQMT